MLIISISSERIILNVNSTNYIEGTPAKLSCHFPPKINILEWRNVDNVIKAPLRCKSESSCDHYTGYHLSRVKDNITLIINQVNRSLSRWECANLVGSLTETVKLNISGNPTLGINITKENSNYYIKTSCSAFPMNVTCEFNGKPLEIKQLKSSDCHNHFLKYLSGYVELSSSSVGTIRCTLQQNNEKLVVTLKVDKLWIYIIGGTIMVIGAIIAAYFFFFKCNYYCIVIGISTIVLGLGIVCYNLSFEAFLILTIAGALVLVITILIMFCHERIKSSRSL